jgi:hypothetical protein
VFLATSALKRVLDAIVAESGKGRDSHAPIIAHREENREIPLYPK